MPLTREISSRLSSETYPPHDQVFNQSEQGVHNERCGYCGDAVEDNLPGEVWKVREMRV